LKKCLNLTRVKFSRNLWNWIASNLE
jgi:hypothetical protein